MAARERPVVVTGADGFVGRALVAHFVATRPAVRRGGPARILPARAAKPQHRAVGDLATASDADARCARRRRGGGRASRRPRARACATPRPIRRRVYRAANVVATERLARGRGARGRARGSCSRARSRSRRGDGAGPAVPRRRSACAAAMPMRAARSRPSARSRRSRRERRSTPIVLRLPLVYGPRRQGQFPDAARRRRARARCCRSAAIAQPARAALRRQPRATRSRRCSTRRTPPAGAWLVADGEAVATPELVRRIAAALGVAPRVPTVPVPLLALAARADGPGRAAATHRRLARSRRVAARAAHRTRRRSRSTRGSPRPPPGGACGTRSERAASIIAVFPLESTR